MKIDPRHLEQLAAIVEHGTLHDTAKHLGTSQPALSRMISTLENRIGAVLFERSSRPLVPTEIGRKLTQHAPTTKATRERAYEDVQLGLRGVSGELKIGAPPFLCERLVGDAISAFLADRPEAEIKLDSDYFPQLERSVLLNQLDVVICPLRLLTAAKHQVSVQPLFKDEHVIVARRSHPLAGKADIAAQDLESATWISHSERSMLRSDMAAALTSIGMSNLRFAFQSASAGAIIEMLRSTDFLTVLPSYAIRNRDAMKDLVALPVRFKATSMTVGMVTIGNRAESPLLSAFARHMREYVDQDLTSNFKL